MTYQHKKRASAVKVSRWVGKVSEGLLAKAVDLALTSAFFGLEFASAGGHGNEAEWKTYEDLAGFNYQTIKRALTYLRQRGFIQTAREKVALPKITSEGKKRLRSFLPQYDERRVWDKRIYLVTYDLPIKNNVERNCLREFLKKIGCGMLQRSIWLTPYNPTKLIQEFTEVKNLEEGLILISYLGKDGAIGDADLTELIEKVYHLQALNERYREFLTVDTKKIKPAREKVIFWFLSILRDDPQLPFELLPKDWLGESAYQFFRRVVQKTK